MESIEDAKPRQVALHPLSCGAGSHAEFQSEAVRLFDVLQHPGEHLIGQDELGPPADTAIENVLWQWAPKQILEVMLGMKSDGRGPNDFDPSIEGELLSVFLVNLDP
jgi:hypothetical protein